MLALGDALFLARLALPSGDGVAEPLLDDLTALNARQEPFATLLPVALRLADMVLAQSGPSSDATFWCGAARDCISGHLADNAGGSVERLADIGSLARRLAMEMDFAFLLDPEKKLLSIGFAVSTNTRDPNCYDLLASEARLASLFAIAKGDVETRHWFRLGRAATPIGAGSALISWSGGMFEYLMPSLVMRAPAGSVLEQTNRLVVAQQIAYGAANALPWGVSESSYNARDLEMTYQYSNFGVPGLGLKRGLSAHRVVAPYATGLGGMILRGDPRLRAPARLIEAGAAPQSALWPLGISGDLPILLFQISDPEDIAALHEVLSAHEHLRMRQLNVDLVILNDRASSYVQDMQTAIDVAVRSAQSRPRSILHQGLSRGVIHTLRADLVAPEVRAMLIAVARVTLLASRGSIGDQIDAMTSMQHMPAARRTIPGSTPPELAPRVPDLEFFNGTGGFADDGREYVTILRDGQTTPAPWSNVIANPSFGFQVSAEGSGSVWSENSRENQLTPWSNDPVTDPSGEAIYLCDLDSGAVWTPTALPIRGRGTYIARHGFGYSSFTHSAQDIDADMIQFAPMDDPVKITRLTLRNTGTRMRRLAVTAYAEWVLGTSRSATADHLITTTDSQTGAMFARNPFATAFPGRVAFADMGVQTSSMTGDRTEVLGRGGTMAAPAGIGALPLSGRTGAALDPRAALQRHITLAPGESATVVFLLGQAASAEAARALIRTHRAADATETLGRVRAYWSDLLTSVQVKTPDRSMDILLNGWLLYQTLACRIWARAGFYQASGAYGFRDQLQDGMALSALRPDMTRAHLLRAAARQFPEGDVQHWWLPHSGQGVRTRISDDRVWLGFAGAQYICVTGDAAILDEQVPFLDGPALAPGVHDDFYQPASSDSHASLFEHCARGIDQAIDLTGANGMPLIGTGDWNDGMNRVGEGGHGTSVWLGWLLIATIKRMAPLADVRDPARSVRWRAHAASVTAAIERDGWDGAWYRRGTFDDGTLLGASESDECRIDSIAQSWAVLSGAADPVRAATAMASMTEHLVRQDPGLALLFTPPFDHTPRDPGYIKGYPPGLHENGGQYSHAAMWAILAHAELGDGDAAGALFSLLNPINHSCTPAEANRYKVEPYVVAADVYSTDPHAGRGGWTWCSGSAGWMLRAGLEGLVGLTRHGQTLHLDPCLPRDWPGLEVTVTLGETRLAITVVNPVRTGRGIVSAQIDGEDIATGPGPLELPLSGSSRAVTIVLGKRGLIPDGRESPRFRGHFLREQG